MKIGFTCSAFDLCHAGHLLMLEEAKEQCDYLIVGLHTNPQIDRPQKNKPVETTWERYERLKACKYVDEIIPYDTEKDLENILLSRKIDVRIIGEEYQNKPFTGDGIVPNYFNRRKHNLSSSSLRQRILQNENNRNNTNN